MVIKKYEPSKITIKTPIAGKEKLEKNNKLEEAAMIGKKLEKNNKPEKVTIVALNNSMKSLEFTNDLNTKTIMKKIDSIGERTRTDITNDISRFKNYITISIVAMFIFSLGVIYISSMIK